jgi:hypothetical protein
MQRTQGEEPPRHVLSDFRNLGRVYGDRGFFSIHTLVQLDRLNGVEQLAGIFKMTCVNDLAELFHIPQINMPGATRHLGQIVCLLKTLTRASVLEGLRRCVSLGPLVLFECHIVAVHFFCKFQLLRIDLLRAARNLGQVAGRKACLHRIFCHGVAQWRAWQTGL